MYKVMDEACLLRLYEVFAYTIQLVIFRYAAYGQVTCQNHSENTFWNFLVQHLITSSEWTQLIGALSSKSFLHTMQQFFRSGLKTRCVPLTSNLFAIICDVPKKRAIVHHPELQTTCLILWFFLRDGISKFLE